MEESALAGDDLCDKHNISVDRLRSKTRQIISSLLNPIKVLPTDEGLPRDWQGFAELVAIPGERISQLQDEQDPTQKIFKFWKEENPHDCTIENLFVHFQKLDRFDIIDDIKDLVDEDIKKSVLTSVENSCLDDFDTNILTRDDPPRIEQGLGPQFYDAFVLFADDDMDFATKLIDTMEKEYNLKFCTKHRDLIAGTFEIDVIVRLIQERCQRLIVIFSNHFFKSGYNDYITKFARNIGIEQSKRKIIPLCYEPCEIPLTWKFYYILDYERCKKNGETAQFWKSLHDSVHTPKSKKIAQEQFNRNPEIKPAISYEDTSSLKAKADGVKFSNSMSDINKESTSVDDTNTNMNTSTSAQNLCSINSEYKAKKKPWHKLFSHSDHKSKSTDNKEKASKKSFFSRSSKRKTVAVAN